MPEVITKFGSAGITVFDRRPAMMDELEANVAKLMAEEEAIRSSHDMLLQVAVNLGVKSRSPFLEIPDPAHRANKRKAESIRTAHDLLRQAYQGMVQTCNIVDSDPRHLTDAMKKLGEFKRGSYQGITNALLGLSKGLYPDIDIDTAASPVYTAFGGLGFLRVTAPEDFRTFMFVENALSYVLRVPITERIFTDYNEFFDGGRSVRPLLNEWNHVQNYPQFLNGNELY